MITRKITIMALIAGIVLGAAATEGYNVYRQSQDSYRQSQNSRIFQERAHCKAVADAYVKENTDLNDSVTLDKVDYSPARNSCVAELETINYLLEFLSVRDLLSGETLFSVSCAKDCVEEFRRLQFVDPAFDYVMKNASKPLELEKTYATYALQGAKDPPPGFIPDAPASQDKSVPPSRR